MVLGSAGNSGEKSVSSADSRNIWLNLNQRTYLRANIMNMWTENPMSKSIQQFRIQEVFFEHYFSTFSKLFELLHQRWSSIARTSSVLWWKKTTTLLRHFGRRLFQWAARPLVARRQDKHTRSGSRTFRVFFHGRFQAMRSKKSNVAILQVSEVQVVRVWESLKCC